MGNQANAYGNGYLMDMVKQKLASGWTQLLAIFHLGEPGGVYMIRQNDCCSYHRTRQSTTTSLIDASDELVTLR
ncbi:unnamed protein product, partial [marine sediment metagenome]